MRPKSIIPSSKAAGAVTLSVLSYPICPQNTVKCLTLARRDRLFEQESQIDVFERQLTLRRAPAKAAHPSRGANSNAKHFLFVLHGRIDFILICEGVKLFSMVVVIESF
ncbi:hypothetical protein Q9233_002454 [Columba guinea]|nr:hypothetical protein Q9233_002454 [Columba guinea]